MHEWKKLNHFFLQIYFIMIGDWTEFPEDSIKQYSGFVNEAVDSFVVRLVIVYQI